MNDKQFIDEREDVQKKTFTKWINSQLLKGGYSVVDDLYVELQDGTKLLYLLEVLTGQQIKPEKGRMRVHHLNNVNKALRILEQNNVKLVNISSNDIVDGNAKLILGLVWSIILHWQVHCHLKHLMAEFQQTNLEKTLLAWCRQNTKDYVEVHIKNFTTSWCDGLVFNALIHRFRPDLFDYHEIVKKHPNARLEHAFQVARDHLAIERLLDPEDVNTSQPDKKSIMTYVMCLFQSLPYSSLDDASFDFSDSGSLASPITEQPPNFDNVNNSQRNSDEELRPVSMITNVSVELGAYQVALEEVLTWLLEAEDQLAQNEPIPDNLEMLKDRFHAHEKFLMELSRHQEGVGAVLEEGARLLSDGSLTSEEADEVRLQMKLLNSRWEALRVNAMEKQSRIHESLMTEQQHQLDDLRRWLTLTEDRISRLSDTVGPDINSLHSQLDSLRNLQVDLQNQQKNVDLLSNLVVIVDEGNNENVYNQMEDQLVALGERWAHICKWAEERWNKLHLLLTHYTRISEDMQKIQAWIETNETLFKQLEAEPVSEIGKVFERMKLLQSLRKKMSKQQLALNNLQESVQYVNEELSSDENKRNLDKVEMLQDKFEALQQIIEAQAHRISTLGFEFNSLEFTESSESLNSDKEEAPPASPQSNKRSWKRRRLASTKRLSLRSSITELQNWIQQSEELLHQKKDIKERIETCQKIETDIVSKRDELKGVELLVVECMEENSSENGKVGLSVEEKKVSILKEQFSKFEVVLEAYKRETELMQEKSKKSEINNLQRMLEEYDRWLEYGPHTYHELQMKLKSLRELEEPVCRFKEQDDSISYHWEDLIIRMTSLEDELMNTEDNENTAKFVEMKTNLMNWIHNVEGVLLSEHPVINSIPVMEAQLKHFKELESSITDHEQEFEFVNNVANEIFQGNKEDNLQVELKELNTRWADIPLLLEERCSKLENEIVELKKLHKEMTNFSNWLQTMKSTRINTLDLNVLIANSELFLEEMNRRKNIFQEIREKETAIQVIHEKLTNLEHKNADPTFLNDVKAKAEELLSEYKEVTSDFTQEQEQLSQICYLNEKINSDTIDMDKLLKDLEHVQNIPRLPSPGSLFQTKGKYRKMMEHIERNEKTVDDIRNNSEKLVSIYKKYNLTDHETTLKKQTNEFVERWTNITGIIQQQFKLLEDASRSYGEFKVLIAQEADWMDKLEKRLRKSPKMAADAEEISEELDDLENCMKKHPESRLRHIQDIGRCLIEEDIMSDKMKSDLDTVTQRWDKLSQQRMADEFEYQSRVFQEMDDQIKNYDIAGKKEAAIRLKEQVLLLEKKFQNLESKFERFRSPTNVEPDLEPKIAKILKELREMEDSLCLLEIASDDPEGIEGQLKLCNRFFKGLSEMKMEVEGVIQDGRKLVETDSVPDPKDCTLQLDNLKSLYNKLGVKVVDAKTCIETALELSKNLQIDITALNKWLDSVESELDRMDVTPDEERDVDIEIAFLAETLEVECVKWGQLKDSAKNDFRAFSSLCDPVYLENLRSRVNKCDIKWKKVTRRLQNTLQHLQALPSDGAEKESCNVSDLVLEESEFKSEESISTSEKVNMSPINLKNQISVRQKRSHDGCGESDTFCLPKESSLFSRISKNEIIPIEQPDIVHSNECHMVAVKECQVGTPGVYEIETSEHLHGGVEYNPLAAEVVEIIETDLDEDIEYANEDEGEYELKPLSPHLGTTGRKRLKLEMFPNNAQSVLLEVTGRINRTEETTVTACGSSNVYDIDVKSTSNKSVKEVKLKKEIEVSRTYQIVGNYEKQETNLSETEECGSFYGSDKETDDVLAFSEDEGHKKDDEDSSSSNEDFCDDSLLPAESNAVEVCLYLLAALCTCFAIYQGGDPVFTLMVVLKTILTRISDDHVEN